MRVHSFTYIGSLLKLKSFFVSIITFYLFSFSLSFAASVPQLINYQGMLTDAQGEPLETKEYILSFSIFSEPTGGTAVWGPQVFDGIPGTGHGAKVPVVRGHFNVILGPKDTSDRDIASAFVTESAYLEITIGDDAPISPRQQILSAPYALQAGTAESVVNNGISETMIKNGAVTNGKIKDDAVTNSKIANSAISNDKVANGTIKQEKMAPFEAESCTVNGRVLLKAEMTDIPDAKVTVTSYGRPILLVTDFVFNKVVNTPFFTGVNYHYVRRTDGKDELLKNGYSGFEKKVANVIIDSPPEGTHQYRLRAQGFLGTGEVDFSGKISAVEF